MPAPPCILTILDKFLETLGSVFVLRFFRFVIAIVFVAVGIAASTSIPRHTVSCPVAILPRVKEYASGGFAISTRSPRFLVKTLERLGHIPMHNEADILLIDSHSKRRGRDNDIPARLIGDPFPLTGHAVVG